MLVPFHDIESLRQTSREVTRTAERARAVRDSNPKGGRRPFAVRRLSALLGRLALRAKERRPAPWRKPRGPGVHTTPAGVRRERRDDEMLTQRLEESAKDRRGGQISHLLLGGRGSLSSERLAVTWVVGEPGSEQERHLHTHSEQVYVIVRGRGLMRVGEEAEEVGEGVLILIPAGAAHSIRNVGEEPLVYVSATTPPFEVPAGRWEG